MKGKEEETTKTKMTKKTPKAIKKTTKAEGLSEKKKDVEFSSPQKDDSESESESDRWECGGG